MPKRLRIIAACVWSLAACAIFATLATPSRAFAQARPSAAQDPTSIEGSLNRWERQLVQEGLILLGFYNGFADGAFGKGTRDAIASFQSKGGRPATGAVTAVDALDLGGTALALRKTLDWQPLPTSSGLRMSYPAALLTKRAAGEGGSEVVESGDGHVSLMTIIIPNAAPDGIGRLFEQQSNAPNNHVTYQFRRPNAFILSGDRQGGKFYLRVEQRGTEIRGYDLIWQPDVDDMMRNVSVLVSNGFDPFGDKGADGEPSYPVLQRLAQQAGQDANGRSEPETGGQPAPPREQASAGEAGTIEQQPDAMPYPTDGSVITSDGKGLRFTYQYEPPQNPDLAYAYQWAKDTHLLSSLPEIDALDGMLAIPRPLHYVATQCGMVNAFYMKDKSAVVLCYELIDTLTRMGEALAKGAADPRALTVEFVRNNIRFILLHESGHAMIDLLDLPAVGREEDSVDQLASVLLLSRADDRESPNDIARVLQLAATWFKMNSADTPNNDVAVFADEHGLDAQRYFNILCFVYGRDPEHFSSIVEHGLLPKARADRCPDESAKITRSWARLLLPHFSPRFAPRDGSGKGADYDGAPAQARTARNPLEWDGKSDPFAN